MPKEYVIYKGSEEVVSSVSPLEITGITSNTEVPTGTYKVAHKGSQEFADIPAFKTLEDSEKPKPPQNLVVTNVKDTSFTVTFDVEEAESYIVYIDDTEYPISTTTLDVGSLSAYSTYEITVASVNTTGIGEKSEKVIQKTRIEAPKLESYTFGQAYLIGTCMTGETITNCRVFKKGEKNSFLVGTATNGSISIYLNNNSSIVENGEYEVAALDGEPTNSVEGMRATFTVLPKGSA